MKDLSKQLVVKELINSLYLIKKHFFWLVIASIIDAAFFLAWGFFTTPVRNKIVEHSTLIANQLSAILAQQELKTGILGHLFGPELKPLTGKLILLVLVLFVVIYVIYNVFHGTAWWMATRIAETKWKYKQYLLGFARVNVTWIAGYIVYKLLDVIISLRYLLIQKISPGSPNIAGVMLFIALVFLIVAAFLSYPTLKLSAIFKTPLKYSVPLVVLSASIFFTARFILDSIGKFNVDAALIAGLVLLFPVMNLIRTYAIRVLSNVHTRN